jgi:hypothetical protein
MIYLFGWHGQSRHGDHVNQQLVKNQCYISSVLGYSVICLSEVEIDKWGLPIKLLWIKIAQLNKFGASRYGLCWSLCPPRQGHRTHFWGQSTQLPMGWILPPPVIGSSWEWWSPEGTYSLAWAPSDGGGGGLHLVEVNVTVGEHMNLHRVEIEHGTHWMKECSLSYPKTTWSLLLTGMYVP